MAAGWVYQHSWHSFIGTGRQKTLMGFNSFGIKCMTRIVGQLWSHWQHPLVHLQKGDVTRKPWRFRRKCNLWVVTPTSALTLSLVIYTQGLGNWMQHLKSLRNWGKWIVILIISCTHCSLTLTQKQAELSRHWHFLSEQRESGQRESVQVSKCSGQSFGGQWQKHWTADSFTNDAGLL
jgi:hypothetical protein